jgi:hypothetical protein
LQQKVSPLAALIIVIVVFAVMGSIIALRNRQDPNKVQETSKRGEEVGQRMMQSLHPGSGKTGP